MLSQLNALIGFAAIFGLLSLLVTSILQIVRYKAGMQKLKIEQMLLNLFGELKDAPRFVAAILTHPTLEGDRGQIYFRILTDPRARPEDVEQAWRTVLKATKGGAFFPWPQTQDLDKQAIKDLGQLVYDRIGHIVDYHLEKPPDDEAIIDPSKDWAWRLKAKLDKEDRACIIPGRNSIDGKDEGCDLPGPGVVPFRGRLWKTAASAFPEAEGRIPPLKTYVAAFYEKAGAAASDAFTYKMRWLAVGVSFALAVLLNLNAIKIWNALATADSQQIMKIAETAQKALEDSDKSDLNDARLELARIHDLATDLQNTGILASAESKERNYAVDLSQKGLIQLIGFFLAVVALSLGAPFWFEILKSGIEMRSAFSKDTKK